MFEPTKLLAFFSCFLVPKCPWLPSGHGRQDTRT